MIAAVRVRGTVDTSKKLEKTLDTLNLDSRNKCVVLEDEESTRGMLEKVKDYITFGEIDDQTLEKLGERRGDDMESNDTVNLSPPSGGFRNIKKQTGQGGALGERDDMDELVGKMV